MKFITDVSILDCQSHNPAFSTLKQQLPLDLAGNLRDYYVPINPYFPTSSLFEHIRENLAELLLYYPEQNLVLSKSLEQFLEIDSQCLVMANGSTELITWIDHLFVGHSLLTCIPTFGRWTDQSQSTGKKVFTYLRLVDDNFEINVDLFVKKAIDCKVDVVVLCNPNNPTGAFLPYDSMLDLFDQLKSIKLIVIDESFIDFVNMDTQISVQHEVLKRHNVIVIKSMGKCLGLHGIRLGYAVSNSAISKKLRSALPYWNINGVAELVLRQLTNYKKDINSSRKEVIKDRIYLYNQLKCIPGLTVYPSEANFVYIRLPDGITGPTIRNYLAQFHGYIIRECSNKEGSSEQFCRIAATPKESTDDLISAIQDALIYCAPSNIK